MRRLAVLLASLLLVMGSVAQAHDDELQAELLDEILRLSRAEVPDPIVLEQIEAWDFSFELSADDIVELRALGVSDDVLVALIRTGSAPAADDGVRSVRTQVYFGAGYYTPWYAYPYAWGAYCDPFPRLYSAYYYPFHYSASFGYYGWYGGTYYAHYHPKHWRRGLRQGGHNPGRPTPYTVAAGRSARPATTVTVPRARSATPQTSTPNGLRSRAAARTATAVRRSPVLRGPQQGRPARSVGSAVTPTRRGSATRPAARQSVGRDLRRDTSTSRRAGQPAVRLSRPATPSQPPRWSGNRSAVGSRAFTMPRSSGFSRVPTGSRAQPMSRPSAPPPSMSSHFRGARPK